MRQKLLVLSKVIFIYNIKTVFSCLQEFKNKKKIFGRKSDGKIFEMGKFRY